MGRKETTFSLLILPLPHEYILYALQRVNFRPFLVHKSHCLSYKGPSVIKSCK